MLGLLTRDMIDSAHFTVVETPMIDTTRLKYLRIALVLVGIIFIFGIIY